MWGIRNLSGLLNKTQLSFPGWLWREKVRGEVLTKPLALTLPAFPPFTCPSGSAREFALSLLRCLGRRTRRSSVLFPLWGWGLCQIPFSVSSGLTHSGVKHTEESWRLWGHRLGSSEAENAADNLCSTQLAWSSEPHTGPSRLAHALFSAQARLLHSSGSVASIHWISPWVSRPSASPGLG